jgi:hypothetical protein
MLRRVTGRTGIVAGVARIKRLPCGYSHPDSGDEHETEIDDVALIHATKVSSAARFEY